MRLYDMEILQKISPTIEKLKNNSEKLDHETFTLEMGELNQEEWSRI